MAQEDRARGQGRIISWGAPGLSCIGAGAGEDLGRGTGQGTTALGQNQRGSAAKALGIIFPRGATGGGEARPAGARPPLHRAG